MKILKISKDIPINKPEGVFSYIPSTSLLREFGIDLKQLYARDNLCLKVFKEEGLSTDDFLWKDNLLFECSKIQNLFAYYEDLAPRIYDILLLKGEHRRLAQVTERTQGDFGATSQLKEKIAVLKDKFNLLYSADPNPKNFIGDKLVDFQNFSLKDPDNYRKNLIARANVVADWGSRKGEVYQDIPEFSLPGQRNTGQRLREMRFDQIDFQERTVLDFGANVGTMTREVLKQEAKKVLAVDLPEVIDVSFEISNFLGYFNIDYLKSNIKENLERIQEKFDIVLFLSVKQIGYSPTIANLCKEMLILEGHVGDHDYTYLDILKKDFKKVEYIGNTRDHGPRPVFFCRR